MSLTVEDYWRALDDYVGRVWGIGEGLVSVLVFGSLVEDRLRPGRSDIDGHVILRERVLADRESFIEALEVMADANEQLARAGIPLNPMAYFSVSELGRINADFMSVWADPRYSLVAFGEDVRDRLGASPASRLAARSAFFDGLAVIYPLAAYLNKRELTADERRDLVEYLSAVQRYPAKQGCLLLDIWPHYPDAVREFERVLPGLDTGVLERIALLKASPEAEVGDGELLELVEEFLVFVEALHDELLVRLRLMMEASGARDYTSLLLK